MENKNETVKVTDKMIEEKLLHRIISEGSAIKLKHIKQVFDSRPFTPFNLTLFGIVFKKIKKITETYCEKDTLDFLLDTLSEYSIENLSKSLIAYNVILIKDKSKLDKNNIKAYFESAATDKNSEKSADALIFRNEEEAVVAGRCIDKLAKSFDSTTHTVCIEKYFIITEESVYKLLEDYPEDFENKGNKNDKAEDFGL